MTPKHGFQVRKQSKPFSPVNKTFRIKPTFRGMKDDDDSPRINQALSNAIRTILDNSSLKPKTL